VLIVELMLQRYANPVQGYRACLDLLRAADTYGAGRLNAARERALSAPIPGDPKRKVHRDHSAQPPVASLRPRSSASGRLLKSHRNECSS